MRTWVRIEAGRVAEVFSTDQSIAMLFPSSLTWVDASGQAGVAQGWLWDGVHFTAPTSPLDPAPTSEASLSQIALQIAALQAQLALLAGSSVSGGAAVGGAGTASVAGILGASVSGAAGQSVSP